MKPEKKKQGLFLTQEDIDTALRAADAPETVIDADDTEALILDEADIVAPDSEDLEFFGLLSKEDVEALLQGDLVGSHADDAQDEVDLLLATAGSVKNTASPAAGGQPGGRNVVQDDVEQLIQKAVAGVHSKAEAVVAETPSVTPDTPKETAAVSQDDIDRLLMNAIDDPGDDVGPGLEAVMDAPEEGGVVSQDEIDRLLMGAVDRIDTETETDFGGVSTEKQEAPASRNDIGSLISQADLDQLMGEALSQGGAKETSLQRDDTRSEHISQSDINRLLKESLEEGDSPEEEEAEASASFDDAEATQPVILAVDEDPHEATASIPEHPPEPLPRKSAWSGYKRKRLLVGAAAGIVLAVAVSMMVMFPGQEETVPQPRVLTFSVPQPDEAVHSARPVSVKSVHLTGFIVLAPPNPAAITYVSADLLLDLSESSFVDVIKENEAYVRDIVYGTISYELMTRDIDTIDETSLELAIRKELGRIIPRGAIERIDFERFSLA